MARRQVPLLAAQPGHMLRYLCWLRLFQAALLYRVRPLYSSSYEYVQILVQILFFQSRPAAAHASMECQLANSAPALCDNENQRTLFIGHRRVLCYKVICHRWGESAIQYEDSERGTMLLLL